MELDSRIDQGMRDLVTAGHLVGWRTYKWHQQWWTVCPTKGRCVDLSRSEALDYLGMKP